MDARDRYLRSIRHRVALVTGAGSGMGRATALLFGAEGAQVVVTDRDEAAAVRVRDAIVEAGGCAESWRLDVADPVGIRDTVQSAADRFGGLDIIINNAGLGGARALDDPDYDANWQRLLAILLTAHQRIIAAALPWLRQSDAARVVNVSSTEALGATRNTSAYAAAKAGVTGLTRALAVELGSDGITVNCVCPGPILTGMTEKLPEDRRAIFARRRTALGRYGEPEEVAHMILSLCIPAASYVTGTTIPIDGGLMARNA